MSNKQIIKKVFDLEFDSEKMKQQILLSYERKRKISMIKYLKYALPVCVILLSGVLIFYNNKSMLKPIPIVDKSGNYNIYINKLDSSQLGLMKIDADVRRVNAEFKSLIELPQFKFLKDLKIPSDLSDVSLSAVYVKENKDSTSYTILHNYDFWYQNGDRRIILDFSEENKPLRDYYFGEDGKVSIINNQELVIYQYNESYLTTFSYGGVNFDIETSDISESEFIEFLVSLIK